MSKILSSPRWRHPSLLHPELLVFSLQVGQMQPELFDVFPLDLDLLLLRLVVLPSCGGKASVLLCTVCCC